MTDTTNTGANTPGTAGGQMGASGENTAGAASGENVTQQPQQYDARMPYNQETQQTEAEVAAELGWAQGESSVGAEGGIQPNVQGAQQPTAIFPRHNPEPGHEYDPEGTNLIPPIPTGERRWVSAQPGALDENQYSDSQYAGIQGDVMGSNPTLPGAPFEQGLPPVPENLAPGNEGFVEGGNEGPPSEAYGQGETRQFAPRGAEPGIEQQEVLQSQQYEREEQRSRHGILGVAGEMLGTLFGNAKRTPTPPTDKEEGEAAGEAHP